MATIKSYTDIGQSKILSKFLPLKSADMVLPFMLKENSEYVPGYAVSRNYIEAYNDMLLLPAMDIDTVCKLIQPCWSLSALLQVLPLGIYDELDDHDYELEIDMINNMPRYVRCYEVDHSQFPYDFEKDTLLDNVVESIIWLNDHNYLEL